MNISWKKKFLFICCVVFLSLLILLDEFLQVNPQPAAHPLEFLFLFFAYVIPFPVIMTQKHPKFNRRIYRYDRRPPPFID
jgi:hypothetical protein